MYRISLDGLSEPRELLKRKVEERAYFGTPMIVFCKTYIYFETNHKFDMFFICMF